MEKSPFLPFSKPEIHLYIKGIVGWDRVKKSFFNQNKPCFSLYIGAPSELTTL